MAFQLEYAYTSHIGKVRENNEDNFWCLGHSMEAVNRGLEKIVHGVTAPESLPLFAVFDGMGGESLGEMAAYEAARSCGSFYETSKNLLSENPEEYLKDLCGEMNRRVFSYSKENKIRSMGTTAAVLTFHPEGAVSANLGDSRIYQFHDRELERLSSDHVLGGGRFGKSPLLQYVGMDDSEMKPEPTIESVTLAMNDCYLLCSDGVTDMLSDSEIGETLKEDTGAFAKAETILNKALEKGGKDNITLVVIRICEEKTSPFKALADRLIRKYRGEKQ